MHLCAYCILHTGYWRLDTAHWPSISKVREASMRANHDMTIFTSVPLPSHSLSPFPSPILTLPIPLAGDARARGGAVHETRPHREDSDRDDGGGPGPARRRGLVRVCGMALTRQDWRTCRGRGRGDLRRTDDCIGYCGLRSADWRDALCAFEKGHCSTRTGGGTEQRNRGTQTKMKTTSTKRKREQRRRRRRRDIHPGERETEDRSCQTDSDTRTRARRADCVAGA